MVIVGRKFLNNYKDEEAIKAAAAKEEEERNRTRCFNLPKIKVAAKKNIHNNRRSQDIEVQLKDIMDAATQHFAVTTIIDSTQNFSAQNKIGEGGFGQVYKGVLGNGKMIAVKRCRHSNCSGQEEFHSELKILSSVKHPNIVRMLGYCTERQERILVYEYMENNSLSCYLFGSEKRNLTVLNWEASLRICLGIAKGLAFVNQEQKIIHRDIKLSNVLLDQHFNPKICDFGLAKRFEEEGKENMEYSTFRLAGTLGYMAPEYLVHGGLSAKTDVYSFGIVTLELISGRKNFNGLLSLACALHEKGDLLAIIDTNFCMNFSLTEASLVLNLAMKCTNPSPDIRPTMTEVVSILEGKTTMETPPFHDKSTTVELDRTESNTMTGNMTMTLTMTRTISSYYHLSSSTSTLGGKLTEEDNVPTPLAGPENLCEFDTAAVSSTLRSTTVLEGDNTRNAFGSDSVFQVKKDYIDEEDKDYDKFSIKEANVATSELLKSNLRSSWSTPDMDESKMENNGKLESTEPSFQHGKIHIECSNEEFEDACNEWKDSIVGCFIGDEPLPMSVEIETVKKLWELKGEVSIFSMENGYFLFQFNCIEDKIMVLESAPWLIDERLLILRKWDWKLKFHKVEMTTLPVWVKIYNLPLFLWSSSFLGKVVSCLGILLYSDRKTDNRQRLSFARLCVEVDASKELPDTLDISVRGIDYKLYLKYDWKPLRCATCCTFGHTEAKCGLKMKKPEQK